MKKKNGRPFKYEVDTAKVQKMASFGNTYSEISDILNVSEDILKKSYSSFYTKGKGSLTERLRKKQINVALKGNVVMLIWLGKQYLGQKDKQEFDLGEKTFEFIIGKIENKDS